MSRIMSHVNFERLNFNNTNKSNEVQKQDDTKISTEIYDVDIEAEEIAEEETPL